jgi:nucleotide-binding universal stress UspA family protein
MPTSIESVAGRPKQPTAVKPTAVVGKPLAEQTLTTGRAIERIKLRRLAACIDGSPYSENVLAHAVHVAAMLDAELTLLRVMEPRARTPLDPVAWDLSLRQARDELTRLADEAGAAVGSVKTAVVEGDAADQIRQWVRQNAIDMTVLATHGERGTTDWGLGSTARKLIDLMPGSLFLVPGNRGLTRVSYRTVLVPLDGSSHAESVLPLAKRLADGERTRLVLAHIVPVPELTETAPMENEARELRERLVRRNRRVAEEYLQRLSAHAPDGIEVRTVSQVADVRTGLMTVIAEQHPDLVVLSAYGRGRRVDVPFGSVAGHLIGRINVPVLVVRGRQSMLGRQSAPAGIPVAAGR